MRIGVAIVLHGLLFATPVSWCCGTSSVPRPRVAVIRSLQDPPGMTVECETADCLPLYIEGASCDAGPLPIAVVSGHSLPPYYLNHDVDVLADLLGCLAPRLIVLDTCYGLSEPLLGALSARGVDAVVVGVDRPLPLSGFRYDPELFRPPFEIDHLLRIRPPDGSPSLRPQIWRLDGGALSAAREELGSWSAARLLPELRHVHPNLVAVTIPGTRVEIVAPVEPGRF